MFLHFVILHSEGDFGSCNLPYTALEGSKYEGRTAILECLVAQSMPVLDKEEGVLRKDLDTAKLSAALKLELHARIESVQKRGIKEKKRLLAHRIDLCLNRVRDEVKLALLSKRRLLVLNLDIRANSKALQKMFKEVQKIAPELSFMGISEEDAGSKGRVLCFAIMPDALTKETGLKVNE